MRGENSFFLFDRWLASGSLSTSFIDISNKQLRVKNCWVICEWNIEFLENLVGVVATEEILQVRIHGWEGMNICVWKLTSDENFTTAFTWEVSRKKKWEPLSWHEWIWHAILSKKNFMCICKVGLTVWQWMIRFRKNSFI